VAVVAEAVKNCGAQQHTSGGDGKAMTH
jgi:hypothetical protein